MCELAHLNFGTDHLLSFKDVGLEWSYRVMKGYPAVTGWGQSMICPFRKVARHHEIPRLVFPSSGYVTSGIV